MTKSQIEVMLFLTCKKDTPLAKTKPKNGVSRIFKKYEKAFQELLAMGYVKLENNEWALTIVGFQASRGMRTCLIENGIKPDKQPQLRAYPQYYESIIQAKINASCYIPRSAR